ncbi:MAG: MotA/TolQ/ExbB proton channel family protein [Myxococcales bacterium]|nr:MotA/TolQ/ExbB proton channel family protein [Myxococcales bacterium]
MIALLIAMAATPASAQQSELEVAYQREFAYLQAEKSTLQSRLTQLDSETRSRVVSTEGEISKLQAQLLAIQARVAEQEELLSAAVRDADGVHEAQELVDATLFQAGSSLDMELAEAVDTTQQAAVLKQAYEAGAAYIAAGGVVTKAPGTYFLTDGSKVQGEIVRVGRVAAYGVGEKSGALIPVGEGNLQLRNGEAAHIATGIAEGGRPNPVGLFVFEDTTKRVEETPPKTLASTIEAGGIVGVVIVLLGLAGVVLAGFRAVGLYLAGRGGPAVGHVLELLDRGAWGEAVSVASSAPGAAPQVMAAMLPLGPKDTKRLEDRASEAILLQTPPIERFGTAIIVIAAVAPLLGLLGTVTGMIGTFEIITEFGTGDPRMLSGGISEALVTTQLGLVVAIPMLLVGNLLNQRAEGLLSGLETAALAVINRADPPVDTGEEPTHVGAPAAPLQAPTHG